MMTFAKIQSKEYYERAFLLEQLDKLGYRESTSTKTNRELSRELALMRVRRSNGNVFKEAD